jgi:UDP-N-acetylglucosamine 2-epimerase (non-hydrolysing)
VKKVKIMSVFGTRPEAIKMAPVVKALEKEASIESVVCVTAQHREMLDQVLSLFSIEPRYDLNLMKSGQTLSDVTTGVIKGLESIIGEAKPDMILVHGDTTTTFSAALSAFYNNVRVGHVEAGLRSGDKKSPFPEEMNRSLTGRIADLHFAPTEGNLANLSKEGISGESVVLTGNTVIDALLSVVKEDYTFDSDHGVLNEIDCSKSRVILLTSHRRENLGEPMENIFGACREIVDSNPDTVLVFPIHMNPKVRAIASKHLMDHDRIHLIEPLDYEPFVNLMAKAHLVLTDSGGIQEEAPAMGKPVLVLRTETERPEAVKAGTVKMAGVVRGDIVRMANELLQNEAEYARMANAVNPYGDGKASRKTVDAIKKYFGLA